MSVSAGGRARCPPPGTAHHGRSASVGDEEPLSVFSSVWVWRWPATQWRACGRCVALPYRSRAPGFRTGRRLGSLQLSLAVLAAHSKERRRRRFPRSTVRLCRRWRAPVGLLFGVGLALPATQWRTCSRCFALSLSQTLPLAFMLAGAWLLTVVACSASSTCQTKAGRGDGPRAQRPAPIASRRPLC